MVNYGSQGHPKVQRLSIFSNNMVSYYSHSTWVVRDFAPWIMGYFRKRKEILMFCNGGSMLENLHSIILGKAKECIPNR